ncbi:MAG: hypothetical protein HXX20_23605 [Chloroflexi bacterium]|nr:hypothetical protein [Chloroflexota bacterium]
MCLKIKALSSSSFMLLSIGLIALVLVACGDSTTTPSPTAVAATTAAVRTTVAVTTTAAVRTTAAVTTTAAVRTTSAATTAAQSSATTAAVRTTSAATTTQSSAATTPSVAASKLTLPAISGATQIEVDPAILQDFTKQLPGGDLKMYASDDVSDKLFTNVDKVVTGEGYKFNIPGQTAAVKGDGGGYIGIYTKTGAPDLIIFTGDVPQDDQQTNSSFSVPGLNAADSKKLADQFKGKKTVAFILVDPTSTLSGMMIALMSFTPGAGGASSTSNPGQSPSAVSNKSLEVSESILPVYPGATRVDTSPGKVGNEITVYYLTTDKFQDVFAWYKTKFSLAENTDISSSFSSSTGQSANLGAGGAKYSVKITILGPDAQSNSSSSDLVKAAKPSSADTVIAVVVSPPTE